MHKSDTGNEAAIREMIRLVLARHESARLLHRLNCILMVSEGRSLCEVAQQVGADRRTIQRWTNAAHESGIDGLVEHHLGGRPARLSREQWEAIRPTLQASPQTCGYADPHWTGKRLALHLNKRYAVEMSIRSCQRMIARSRASVAG